MSISNLKQVKDLLIKEAAVIDVGGVSIYSNGGIDLDISSDISYAELDLAGAVEGTITGEEVTFSFEVPEVSYDIISELYTYGDTDTAGTVGIGTLATKYVTDYSQEVTIEPFTDRSGASATWSLSLYKVHPDGDLSLGLSKDDPWNCSITMRALPDLSKADGKLIGEFTLNSRGAT